MQGELFFVRWLKDGIVIAEDQFADLEGAKHHATEQIKLYRALNLANSALVCDKKGAEYIRVF